MSQGPADVFTGSRRRFYRLSAWAIRHGLLTAAEMRTIARLGTRKQNYWSRHLLDLRLVLRERIGHR